VTKLENRRGAYIGFRGTPVERFWRKVELGPDCWTWTGYRNRLGYGYFYSVVNASTQAHRFAYELLIGPIPPGLHIDHLCRNPSCVNPLHMEAVTPGENVLRGESAAAQAARRNHCAKGHEYTLTNTYWQTGRYGKHKRACRRCHADTEARRRARLAELRKPNGKLTVA
jgi:hypothetical protein